MVIKLADVEMEGKKKSKTSAGGKRRLEVVANVEDISPDPDSSVGELKKAKPAVDEDVLKSLAASEIILASSAASHDSKMQCLSDLFQSILDKNVNVVLITTDFPAWVKNAISIVLKGVTQASIAFFNVITLSIKVAPAVIESLLESVLNIALFYSRANANIQESCDNFMEFIVHTFEKLRRFPKFIAKFLCCIRDNLKPKSKNVEKMMCSKFKTAVGSVINLLTVGQITDLWKMLQHNLEVECIKPLKEGTDDKKTEQFLYVVVELFVEFLSNIRVADYAIPAATVEKISEMMEKLSEECLKPFGLVMSGREKLDLVLVRSYLSLAYAFGQLHGIMLCYNARYNGKKPSFNANSLDAADLSYLQSYMSGEFWITFSARVLKRDDSEATQLLVNLVAQKMTFMTALWHKFNNSVDTGVTDSTEKSKESQEMQLKDAAEFIWTNQNKNCVQFSDETLILVSQYIEPRHILELAGICIQQLEPLGKSVNISIKNSSYSSSSLLTMTGNPTFHYSLILQALTETMRRIQKMKLLPNFLKALLADVLSLNSKTTLIVESPFTKSYNSKTQNASHNIMESLLSSANSSILNSSSLMDVNSSKKSIEYSSQLINGILEFLSSLDIDTYPKDVKTVVFLCSLIIFVALSEQTSDNLVLESVSKLVVSAGIQSQGNEILFGVHWVQLFKWYTANIDRFSSTIQHDWCNMILSNVFMSPKFVTEFEKELQTLCTVDNLSSSLGRISLMSLEFLLKELHNPKTRLVPQLQDHCRKLVQFVVNKLANVDTTGSPNFYQACWLAQLSIDRMDEDTLNLYRSSLAAKIKKSLKYLKASGSVDCVENDIVYAIRFLHTICKSQTKVQDVLPAEFFSKIWKSCLSPNILQYDAHSSLQLYSHKLKIPNTFVKDIFQTCNTSDFLLICDSLVDRTTALADTPHNFKEISMVVQILAESVDAELSPENKPIRRHTLQECLHKIPLLALEWDINDNTCLNNAVIPYLKLQTKILRRRGAMVNLKTLAVCLTSVTSVPLALVEDSSTFKTLFCTLTDLMNALVVHRLDVIAFRSHIFLQCFQYLIECLTRRADQKNKLSDGEILNVRTCGHSIERLCQSMKLGQKEFSRVSPYFVTVLIKQFEILAVYPAVKVPLLGGCYKLLDLCDEHGISQLNSLLTSGSKEILKAIYDQYKKYYQYKGRV